MAAQHVFDLAIIGGGITGALVAHRFAREGIRTVLLEAGEIGYASTAATKLTVSGSYGVTP